MRGHVLLAIISFLFVVLEAHSRLNHGPSWPMRSEKLSREKAQALQSLEHYLFANNSFGLRQGPRTEAVLVLQNGQMIYEKYDRGYNEVKKHIAWSISKTIMAFLYGVAIKEGRAQLSQSICDVASFSRPEYCRIRVQDVLTWSTAIRWAEEYEKTESPKRSSILAMLYGEGHQDMAKFVQNHPLELQEEPGRVWRYSSGDSTLASYILTSLYKEKNLREVYREKIFDPLGLKNWTWESDLAGTLVGAAYFHVAARDLARIGELILNDGVYGGREILPAAFVRFMKTMPDAFKKRRLDMKKLNISGAHLWINDPHDTGLGPAWPGAPRDAVAAMGHWGQYLVIIPSQNLVAVRFGDTRDDSVSIADFAAKVSALGAGSIRHAHQ